MLTYDDNQKATKAHCRLAFSAQPQRFFLPLLVGLHGSTDTTSRKSAIEENMFWKVTPTSSLIFSAKDVCTINFTVSFYLYLYLQPREKCFFFRRWVTWSWYSKMKRILYFVSLAAWLSFLHAKLTARGEERVRILAIECLSVSLFFSLPTVLVFFHDQTHTLTQTRKVRRHTEGPKGDKSGPLHSISGLQINFWLGAFI